MQTNKVVIFFDIDYTLFNTDIFKKTRLREYVLYNEVEEVLADLKKIAKLGIFSEGKIEFQKTKLEKTKIKKYFLKKITHIVEDKKNNLNNIFLKYLDTQVFLIDDKLSILYEAQLILPSLITIWIKRGKYARFQKRIKNFEPNAIIGNLKEAIPIIKSF